MFGGDANSPIHQQTHQQQGAPPAGIAGANPGALQDGAAVAAQRPFGSLNASDGRPMTSPGAGCGTWAAIGVRGQRMLRISASDRTAKIQYVLTGIHIITQMIGLLVGIKHFGFVTGTAFSSASRGHSAMWIVLDVLLIKLKREVSVLVGPNSVCSLSFSKVFSDVSDKYDGAQDKATFLSKFMDRAAIFGILCGSLTIPGFGPYFVLSLPTITVLGAVAMLVHTVSTAIAVVDAVCFALTLFIDCYLHGMYVEQMTSLLQKIARGEGTIALFGDRQQFWAKYLFTRDCIVALARRWQNLIFATTSLGTIAFIADIFVAFLGDVHVVSTALVSTCAIAAIFLPMFMVLCVNNQVDRLVRVVACSVPMHEEDAYVAFVGSGGQAAFENVLRSNALYFKVLGFTFTKTWLIGFLSGSVLTAIFATARPLLAKIL
jgi:hypothetical protein